MDEKRLREVYEEQRRRAHEVIQADIRPIEVTRVTGVDVAYADPLAVACAVEMDIHSRRVLRVGHHVDHVEAEYIPGAFQLREGPPIIRVLRQFRPDGPVLIDANGILHPRRFGLACLVGVELGIQTIGVAKSLLLGTIRERAGDVAMVTEDDEVLGAALWPEGRGRPIYVSVGHGVSLETAIRVVRSSIWDGAVQPIREAHILSGDVLKHGLASQSETR